jgi:uncharacterized Zn-binding protein involved in type VI secretion
LIKIIIGFYQIFMAKIARKGDAISHGGAIIQSSPNTEINDRQIARLGDTVVCAIHGTQTIISASNNLKCNGIPVARVGDLVSCGAIIIEGSDNTFN